MRDVLVICGPTATGKTAFALEICREIPAEIVSADSRQVYRGMDIVTGKDIPVGSKFVTSSIKWGDKYLGFYPTKHSKIWLYDLVSPDDAFSVSHWHQAAELAIQDILRRHKLPIIVGGTGLYIKSLLSHLTDISTPPNLQLRRSLSKKSPKALLDMLSRINSSKAASLNQSDRVNPRRLIRAIEIGLSEGDQPIITNPDYNSLLIGLSGPRDYLKNRIDQRITDRLQSGAKQEAESLINKYSPNLPSMSATGYRAFLDSEWIAEWKTSEHQYLKRQLTWFNRQPNIDWFDVSTPDWKFAAKKRLLDWYNKSNVQKD